MKTPLIIPIGRSKSGKDELYKIVKAYYPDYEVVRFSFADYLYELTAETLGISVEELRKEKEKYRHYLIFGGMFARKINPNVWVDRLEDVISQYTLSNKFSLDKTILVATDCRFDNEISMLCGTFSFMKPVIIPIFCTKETLQSRGYNFANYDHESETMIDDLDRFNRARPYMSIQNNSSHEKYVDEVVTRVSEILEECK